MSNSYKLDLSDNDNDDNDNNDNNDDKLELYGSTIVYKTTDRDIVDGELRGFETCRVGQREIDEDDADDASVLVEFDAEISCEKAIGTLKMIIAQIEAHGVPPTSLVLPRNLATLIVKMEPKKPDEIRELVRRLLPKTSGRP